jgi:NTP pyrophosphatase (non-canonical NTP hydrolase)
MQNIVNAQARVAEATRRRGYREGWTAEQFLARQVAKLQEELAEMAMGVHFDAGTSSTGAEADVMIAGRSCRELFDRGNWSRAKLSPAFSLDYLRGEIADLQVVLYNLADALGEIAGEPFDVAAAAVEKATADERRGVRCSNKSS